MKFVEPSYKILDCPDGEAALALLEYIGRKAYKSEDKITPGVQKLGATPDGKDYAWKWLEEPSSHAFIRMIMKADRRERLKNSAVKLVRDSQPSSEEAIERVAREIVDLALDDVRDNPAHTPVIEHCKMTCEFVVNRGVTHELVRHRIASFLQTSTRYCNYSKGKFGSEVTNSPMRTAEELCDMLDEYMGCLQGINDTYIRLTKGGVKPEIARGLLGQDTMAEIVMTANFVEWRHVFRLRGAKSRAHPDMKRVIAPLHEEMIRRIPIIFDYALL